MAYTDTYLQSPEDVERRVNDQGFLPYFRGEIDGFSIEEQLHPDYWFPEGTVEGMWEWKGEVIIDGDCAYGKFYQNKACYISMEWYPDWVNYRRSQYVLTPDELHILEVLKEHQSLISRDLKKKCGYTKPRAPRLSPLERLVMQETGTLPHPPKDQRESFDTAITRLQMSGHVLIANFEYLYDKKGRRYGWGLARYCTPEDFFGAERMIVSRTPEESKQRLSNYLHVLLPHASEEAVARVVG